MFTRIALTAAIASTLLTARADPTPTAPGPDDIFNEGAQCHVGWNPDTTGVWTTMSIELMTGDNFNMVHLTTVVTLDGTDPTKTSFDYTCPQVNPNSAIYFYQFSTPANSTKLWTTRFAIADASGNTTPPPQATQPGGQAIPWGAGQLSNPSDATPPPAGASPSGGAPPSSAPGSSAPPASVSVPASSPAAPSPAASSPAASLPPSSASPSLVSVRPTPTTNSSSSKSGNTTSSDASNANGAVSLDSRVLQTLVALGATAFAFAVVL